MRSEYMAKTIRKYFGIIFICLILAALPFLPRYLDKKDLESNRAKWEKQNITHYRFDLDIKPRYSIYTPMPLTIEVQDGQIIKIVDANGEKLDQGFETVGTVEGLFDCIQEGLSGKETVASEYDRKYGFPTLIYTIEIFEVKNEYKISNFEILP